jgi:shikimate kinase
MERCGLDPWTPFQSWYKQSRPHYEKLVIATRGGVIAAPQRIAQMLTIRGDERCAKVVLWLATKAYKLLKSTRNVDARPLVTAIKQAGFPAEALWEQLSDDYVLPWANIEYPVKWTKRWDNA